MTMICVHRAARRTIPASNKRGLLWALFGNEDDGFYGDANWNPQRKTDRKTAIKWWFRNPAHNLTFYVLGVADKERLVCGPHGDDHQLEGGGFVWSFTMVMGSKIKLPYINYTKGRIKAYAGWRPSGAFGFKLNFKLKAQ
jgi:hypothetical protein